uniref:Uncharacterized protein n=1 Tax=Amphimedon queenslandica TaxID=400682 RepID=A0A1X7VRB5_AMPQE
MIVFIILFSIDLCSITWQKFFKFCRMGCNLS